MAKQIECIICDNEIPPKYKLEYITEAMVLPINICDKCYKELYMKYVSPKHSPLYKKLLALYILKEDNTDEAFL